MRGMLVAGDAGKCRARLALTAGQQRHHLVARQVAVGLLVEERRRALEHAKFAGDVEDAAHGATDNDDVAAGLARRPARSTAAGRHSRRTS